ncbi:hypothetical protein BMS3Abin02_01881 [bacterium BMS3Abin02]|nr:hypothetical protein BMS3Abin02_01881 [bacterium BMS3Abin02]
MDRRHDVAHVAHVRGSGHRHVRTASHGAPERRRVTVEQLHEYRIADQVLVRMADCGSLPGAAGGDGGGFETGHHLLGEFLEVLLCRSPDVPGRPRVTGDDVRCVTAVSDDPVQTVTRKDLLAQRRYIDVRLNKGVQCVDPLLGRTGGMRVLAVILEVDVTNCQDRRIEHIVWTRVNHHRDRCTVKCAGVDQVDFPAFHLFGGSAENGHTKPQLIRQSGQCQTRAHRRRGDDVVPARVADTGKRVVFGTDHHLRPVCSGPRHESGVQTVGRILDGKAMLGKVRGQLCRCCELLKRNLGMFIHPVTDALQILLCLGEPLCGDLLGIHTYLHSASTVPPAGVSHRDAAWAQDRGAGVTARAACPRGACRSVPWPSSQGKAPNLPT